MKMIERSSMWHHTLFSLLLCAAMVALFIIRRDVSSLIIIGVVFCYVLGNTLLHVRRQDFQRETLYEYVLISAAVLIVLLGALRH